MDGIQSWSTFEQQQRNNHVGSSSDQYGSNGGAVGRGIDALYVSSASPDIAPSAARELRLSGLTIPATSNNVNAPGDDVGADGAQQRNDEEEFRLRFHWMRPHPSLAFALEEELAAAKRKTDISSDHGMKSKNEAPSEESIHPAAQAAKLMEAYRYSQITKQVDDTADKDSDEEGDKDKDKSTNSQANNANLDLTLELPKLRINLASLVEPPLMTSWLPGADTYSSDDEVSMVMNEV